MTISFNIKQYALRHPDGGLMKAQGHTLIGFCPEAVETWLDSRDISAGFKVVEIDGVRGELEISEADIARLVK